MMAKERKSDAVTAHEELVPEKEPVLSQKKLEHSKKMLSLEKRLPTPEKIWVAS